MPALRCSAVQSISYDGPSFDGARPARALADMLRRRDTLIELPAIREAEVVLGVPHHAAIGVDRIAEKRPEGGRVADENAVMYALACRDRLRVLGFPVALVIAAHASDHDPNKLPGSPYCQRVLQGKRGSLLVECHGASQRAPHDLEVTAGKNQNSNPLAFTRSLVRALGPGFHAAAQITSGSRGGLLLDGSNPEGRATTLRFPALRTHSLLAVEEREISALHIEAKPRFRMRMPLSPDLTAAGQKLGDAMAEAIAEHHPA